MLGLLKELFALLDASQRRRFYVLQLLVILMAFAEIVGISSIIPFMALVGDISRLNDGSLYQYVYDLSGVRDPYYFVTLLGVLVLFALALSSIISIFTIWRLALFGSRIGYEISGRLYENYMRKDWMFHANHSSAQLVNKISVESQRVTGQIIQPLMQMNARLVVSLFLVTGIFVYSPYAALTASIIFVSAYIFVFKFVRGRLQKNGSTISSLNAVRFRLMSEGFGGIKEIILHSRQLDYTRHFYRAGSEVADAQGSNQALAQSPRYLMEFLAFGVIIATILFLLDQKQGDLAEILPILSVFALAGFKLLPSMQQIYSSLALIKGAMPAFESIRHDLVPKNEFDDPFCGDENDEDVTDKYIAFRGVGFSYPGSSREALSGVNIDIRPKTIIGLVGSSGAGKSTLIDLMLGLIYPGKGEILIDGDRFSSLNIKGWQDHVGFVPQSIFLSEGTIAENVAFGMPADEIDFSRVFRALDLSHLGEMVRELPEGINTRVGERGVKLSGGQRQRIGIARALYHDPSVLVFDEATSALDGISEKAIMDAINDFSGEKTIIIVAHRLNTVRNCDVIYFMRDGSVSDVGTFNELLEKNQEFRRMADHA